METEEKEFLIDIDQIIKDKAGDKAKYIPGFVVSWLKRTLHQDEVNRFLGGRAKGKLGIDFLDECVDYLEMDLKVKGLACGFNEGIKLFYHVYCFVLFAELLEKT